MKNTILIFLLLVATGFNSSAQQPGTAAHSQLVIDTTPRVVGIGGIFFKSKAPKETREWYHKQLGMATSQYGTTFESRNINKPEEIDNLQWTVFNEKTKYFEPSTKEFMINYRVQHIEKLVENLRASGVTIADTIQGSEYGKFVHILDPDGNKLELWEPVNK
jgi:predicted enzyme related to lactoylglutathione lyase